MLAFQVEQLPLARAGSAKHPVCLLTVACSCLLFPCCSDSSQRPHSFIYWVWELQQASTKLGQPLHDFLLRPTEGPTFMERPMSSAAIHDRFITHLRRLGLYQGGSRSSIMQQPSPFSAPGLLQALRPLPTTLMCRPFFAWHQARYHAERRQERCKF